ncbi:MAG TPA: serine/threonine-protein kinase [Candidatus Obscuribacterales bacterium]
MMQEQFTEFEPMKACPICARLFDGSVAVCDVDGYELVQAEDDPLIGTWLLDRYAILSVVGAGGWGRVYKARHLTLGTVVAIKTLYLHLATNKEKVTRFEQEARAACALRHENIAAVYDFGTMPNGQPFIVMDFLGGQNLHTVLNNEGKMEPARAVRIFKQICAGLAAAHDRGIVHRDIKPGNIVLLSDIDRGELVKLFDFGLAKLHLEDGTSLNDLTQTGETVGTPAYMSPEQCQGWKLDHRTDLYSLGCVMYECLTGVQAFYGPTTYECMSRHVNQGAAPFSEVLPGRRLPVALEELVFKALEKDPKRRYQTAREMLADLSKYEAPPSSGTSIGTITMHGVVQLKRPWRNLQRSLQRHKRAILMGATTLGLLVASCLLVYQGWRGFDPSQMAPNDRWLYLSRLGTTALMSGNYDQADEQLKRALSVAETFSTADKRRVTLANQALLYHITRRSDKERDADKHLDPLLSHDSAAPADNPQLDNEEAQFLSAMLDKAVNSKPADKEQLRSLGDRINKLCLNPSSDRPVERKLVEKSSTLLKQYLGEDDPTYALSLQRLAYGHYLDNDHATALQLWLQCLPIRSANLKRTDPEYFRLLAAVGKESVLNNKLEDAEKYLEEAAEMKDSEPLLDSQASALSELALVYQRLGNDKQAYDTWKRLYDLWDRAGTYEQADLPFIELVYAGNRVGLNADTESFLISRRAALVSHYGPDASGVAAYSLALAELYLIEGQYEKAEAAANQALEIRELCDLPGYLPVRRAMETLGRVYLAQKKYTQALPVYDAYLACAERNVAADKNKGLLLDALAKAAYVNTRLGNDKQAADYMMRFHVLLAGMTPSAGGYDCTRALDQVFTALKGIGLNSQDYLQLEQLLAAERATTDRWGSVISAPNAQVEDAMSRVYALAGRWKDAQESEERAIDLLKKGVPASGWIPGSVYSHYASVLSSLGKADEAARAQQEAQKYPNERI